MKVSKRSVRVRVAVALSLSILASPAYASELRFFEISADTIATNSKDIQCVAVSDDLSKKDGSIFAGNLSCKLTHSSFAGVPINVGRVKINPDTYKVRSITVIFHSIYVDRVRLALATKYGEPERMPLSGRPYWAFTNGDQIYVSSRGMVNFYFAANRLSATDPVIDF